VNRCKTLQIKKGKVYANSRAPTDLTVKEGEVSEGKEREREKKKKK